MPSAQIADKYGSFFHLARQHQVIFYYVGYFSQNIVAAMAEAVRLQLEVAGVPAPRGASCSRPLSRWRRTSSITRPMP